MKEAVAYWKKNGKNAENVLLWADQVCRKVD